MWVFITKTVMLDWKAGLPECTKGKDYEVVNPEHGILKRIW